MIIIFFLLGTYNCTTEPDNRPCIFPFVFMGIVFDKCAYYEGQPACATQVDEDGTAVDYGFCGPCCPTLGMIINSRYLFITMPYNTIF